MKGQLLGLILCPALLAGCAETATTSGTREQAPPDAPEPPVAQPVGTADDASIEQRIDAALARTPSLGSARINVTSFEGMVLLTGQVPSQQAKTQATNAVAFSGSGMRNIFNELQVAPNIEDATMRSDAELARSITATLEADEAIQADEVHVVVDNQIVYLMGSLPREDATAIVSLVGATEGVETVRTVFQFTDEIR